MPIPMPFGQAVSNSTAATTSPTAAWAVLGPESTIANALITPSVAHRTPDRRNLLPIGLASLNSSRRSEIRTVMISSRRTNINPPSTAGRSRQSRAPVAPRLEGGRRSAPEALEPGVGPLAEHDGIVAHRREGHSEVEVAAGVRPRRGGGAGAAGRPLGGADPRRGGGAGRGAWRR